ncbi:MAG: ferritin-like domain-containing protein [Limnohabitans sp.]
MELRTRALQALQLVTPGAKCDAVEAIWAAQGRWTFQPAQEPPGLLPGRPDLPRLIPPGEVPRRTPFTAEGRAALVHAICHIEFNAINLALDAVWRFDGMPEDFYRDWMRVAHEESQHFGMLHRQLQAMDHRYGDFEAHDGLWEMCEKTASDITARMALVPRTLEARGLDATPLIQARLRKVGSPDALRIVDCLDVILREEIGHVDIGNRWYRWLCERQGLEPVAHYKVLVHRYRAPRLRPPFNLAARQAAGFSTEEIAYLSSDGLDG